MIKQQCIYCTHRRCDTSANSSSQYKTPDSTLIGKRVELKFKVNKIIKWFSGEMNSYNDLLGQYGVYFPCDSILSSAASRTSTALYHVVTEAVSSSRTSLLKVQGNAMVIHGIDLSQKSHGLFMRLI